MKPRKTLRRMATQAWAPQTPTTLYIDKFLDKMAGKLWLYDQQGETSPRIGSMRHHVLRRAVGHHAVPCGFADEGGRDEDDYNGQKKFVGKLQSLARDLNVHIHLITHSRKREDETKRPGKQDNKGSGSIVDQTDNFVSSSSCPRRKTRRTTRPDALPVLRQAAQRRVGGAPGAVGSRRPCPSRSTSSSRWASIQRGNVA
jgi:hypothetical protein